MSKHFQNEAIHRPQNSGVGGLRVRMGDFFKNCVCSLCKRILGAQTKYCSRCKEVTYCSINCQQQAFAQHKALCRVIAQERKFLDYNVKNFRELVAYKKKRGYLWQVMLGRPLTKFETQMFIFSRCCAICFTRKSLFCCQVCFSEFYCSKEHQLQHEVHKQFCQDLKLSLDIECYFYHNDYINTLTVKQMDDNLEYIPKDLPLFLNSFVESDIASGFNFIHGCDQILSGITLLYALEQCGYLVKRNFLMNSLELHVIGSNDFETSLNWRLILEIVFHWVKNLCKLHVVFIGPEATPISSFSSFKQQFCQHCQKRKLIIEEPEVYNCLYHEAVQNISRKPDVIVAFNSGLHEFYGGSNDTWQKSIGSLVENKGVPLVLTAYTENEIEQDVDIIKKVNGVEVAYGPIKNFFCNQRPLQDWATENVPIYFINNFLAVVKKVVE